MVRVGSQKHAAANTKVVDPVAELQVKKEVCEDSAVNDLDLKRKLWGKLAWSSSGMSSRQPSR